MPRRTGPGISPLAATARAAASGNTAGPAVFVNELHYDNTGIDSGEAVELAGPAGTDLTGWALVACNGATGAAYDTRPLGGTLPGQQGDFGTHAVDYPTHGLQNGSPDGLALVDPAGVVVQVVSDEGTVTRARRPRGRAHQRGHRRGRGVIDACGASLQLTGQGSSYEEMTWAAAGRQTCSAGRA